ncbi:MAG: hypothetical protein JXR23_02415 [Pontiellaceae bacterium]|nr:hypothetical protein [Pontiellaceae bacterium]
MISLRSEILAEQEAWTAHLQALFRSLNIPPNPKLENLTAAVALYCRQNHPYGVQRADLNLLVARAFCAVNERDYAVRVLQSLKPHNRHVERWLEVLCELHHFPVLLPFFSLGIIRPADWAGAQLDRMWTLDLGRLALSAAEQHEMLLYRSLRSIIEHMFVFWDAVAGEGVLGLKGLASFNLEPQKKQGRTFTSADDLLTYIGDLFLRQQEARGWRTVPVLMNLDL